MTKPKNKKFGFDFGLLLLITGALANITIWIGAFVATESQGPVGAWVRSSLLPILGGVSGLAMGITVTAGLVYVLGRLGRMKATTEHKMRGKKDKYHSVPNMRFYGAWASIILLLIISPAMLAPYVFMTISGAQSLYAVLGESWARIWSVGRIVAADLAMSAVALVHGVHFAASGQSARTRTGATGAIRTPKAATQSDARAKGSARTPKGEVRTAGTAADMRPCDVPGCGIPYRWPQGKGAHFKKHHPDLVIQKGIPVQMGAQVDSTGKGKQ